MATVKDYVKGANIDPVTGKSIKSVTTGASGNPADLTEPIQASNGSYMAPGFGNLQDQSMDFYPDAVPSQPGTPAAPIDNVQAKGGRSSDPVADAKAAGQVTTFGNFLKALKAGSMLIGTMGPIEGALAQATGQVDYTGDFGNYNQRPGWNDAFDAGMDEAKKKGIQDVNQQVAYAQQYAHNTLPDPTTTAPTNGANADPDNPYGGGDGTTGTPSTGDTSESGGTGFNPTPEALGATGNYGDESNAPSFSRTSDSKGGADDGSGGLNGVGGGSSGGPTKGDFSGGDSNSGHSGGDGGGKGGGSSSGGGTSGGGGSGSGHTGMGDRGYERGGTVIRDNPQGSTVAQDKASDGMSSEATYMMPKSATSFNRGGPVTKQAPAKGNWIQDATKNAHGQFAAKAKAAGMTTQAFAQLHRNSSGLLGEQARLALTLMSKGGGKPQAAQARPSMATGGVVTQAGYEDGGTVLPQAPVGPGANAPRPQGAPAPSGDAGPMAETPGDPGDQPGAAPGAPDDGRFNPTAAQVADDGVTDNQQINADEGEYVVNKQSVAALGIPFLNWLDDPANAAELADVLQAIEGAQQNGGGAGGGMPPVGGSPASADPIAAAASGPDAPADLSAMSMGPGAGAPLPPPGGAGAPPPFPRKRPAVAA